MSNLQATQLPPTATPPPPVPASVGRAWTAARITILVLTTLAFLGAAGMVASAAALDSFDEHHRQGGYLTTDATRVHTDGFAATVEEIDLDGLNGDWLLGSARLRATSPDPDRSVFVGIAPSDEAADYLRGVGYATVTELDDPRISYDEHTGGSPSVAPAKSNIWSAQSSGTGTQTVTWTPRSGEWTVVVMNSDGTSGIDVKADVGATVPALRDADGWLGTVGVGSAAFGLLGVVVLVVGDRRRRVGLR
jgi:hypothetical protein